MRTFIAGVVLVAAGGAAWIGTGPRAAAQDAPRASESAPQDEVQAPATLTALVRAPTGAPVAGARVVLFSADCAWAEDEYWFRHTQSRTNPGVWQSGTTGADGACRIDGIEPAQWGGWARRGSTRGRVRFAAIAAAPGFATSRRSEAFEFTGSPPSATVGLVLRPSATIDVVVRDPDGAPVPHTRVAGGPLPDRTPPALMGTYIRLGGRGPDAQPAPGEYRFTDLTPARHAVEVRADGFVPVRRSWTVGEGAALRDVVQLVRAVPVRIRVLDDRGEPVAGADVDVDADDATRASIPEGLIHEAVSGRTGPDGTFVATALGPWTATIRVLARGHVERRDDGRTRTAAADRRADAPPTEIRLVRLGTARLRLVVPEGTALPADVVIRTVPLSWSPVVAGPRITVRPSAPWAGGTVLCAAGWAPVEIGSRMRPGEDVDLGDVVLDPGVTLRGRVRDAEGLAVAGAFVRLVQRDSAVDPHARTGPDGTFDLAHAVAGENEVLVIAAGRARRTFRVPGADAAELVVPARE